jgi:Ca-activated chloride channel family protein
MCCSPCALIVPLILLAALALADLPLGTAPGVQAARPAQFVSGVSAVEVYATVTDDKGQPVTGLTAADFVVEEDGQRQTAATFAAGEFPLAVALAVDRSFSVPRERLNAAAAAARGFVQRLRPSDQVMVLAIGSEIDTLAPLSSNHVAVMDALAKLEPWGTTPLFDAMLAALDAIQSASGRRALILLSDGQDRYSRTTAAELVEQSRRRDVLIYPIATGRTRAPVFAELAAASGGRSFQAGDPGALQTTLAEIAQELRSQYLLGYTPARAAEEQRGWRSIRVTVNRPNVRVRARDGYFVR